MLLEKNRALIFVFEHCYSEDRIRSGYDKQLILIILCNYRRNILPIPCVFKGCNPNSRTFHDFQGQQLPWHVFRLISTASKPQSMPSPFPPLGWVEVSKKESSIREVKIFSTTLNMFHQPNQVVL